MLEAQGKFNQLSNELRKELDEKAESAGRFIKYKFDISHKNPDGQMTNGEFLWPQNYTLTPATYAIVDPGDKKLKNIALVGFLKENGAEYDHFLRVTLLEPDMGILTLDMAKQDDRDRFAFIEMHPKMSGGMFRDNESVAVISRIDEVKVASQALNSRTLRINAMYVASQMPMSEVMDFAAAIGWNEHEEAIILREKITALAENDPEWFRNFIDNKSIEYRSAINRARDNNIINWLPVESKFVWASNKQTIAVLDRVEGGNELERMTDWIMTSKNGMEVFTKLKSMLSQKAKV